MNWLIRTLLHGRNMPRVIEPKTHEVLDWLVTGYFLVLAGAYWGTHKRAAATALINAGVVAGLIATTDYEGNGEKPLSFVDHGKLDLVQAGLASGLPVVMGFAAGSAALPFQFQAMDELVVVAATDWDATGRDSDIDDLAA